MDLELRGKMAMVSGSATGIGLAIATTVAEEEAAVVINGRTEERVRAALDSIRKSSSAAQVRSVVRSIS